MKQPYLLIGVCLRPHGVNGELLIKSLGDDDTRFQQGLLCYVTEEFGTKPLSSLRLKSARSTPRGLLLEFDGIDTREKAKALTGRYLAVSRDDAVELNDAFEFYYGDLLGMRVIDERKGPLGTVQDIMDTGTADILVVKDEGQPDLLFPFLKSIIQQIDQEEDVIQVILPPGLYELYRGA
jgi:16S rRNA processing protein RimM